MPGLRFADVDLRVFPGGHPESWHAWWEAAAADPALAGHVAERSRRRVDADHHGTQSTQLATHVEALEAAGFAEVGTSGSAATTASSAPSCRWASAR